MLRIDRSGRAAQGAVTRRAEEPCDVIASDRARRTTAPLTVRAG
ncbi:ATP-dependent Clp protease adaptor ClpS [Oerskovia sp. KBS0722]|nr:ATP-dependent Clp protease adaptor ClpS [Oerskovia sp. KBS0722]QDW64097.1 ATP-dependent Clp protease adaptor ClpS [Oerskovia sp. KBS0722]